MLISFGEVLEMGVTRLQSAGIGDARRDAESLLLFFVNEGRTFLFLHKNDGIDEAHAEAYFDLVDRRAEGEPLQYIVGSQEFMGLDFKVTPDVLIPRQDTETLVELALEKGKAMKGSVKVLDMCTGSGAIAVSVAKLLSGSKVSACDISSEALAVARENAAANGVDVKFEQTDMFTRTHWGKQVQIKGKFDMILSNPPYIPTQTIETLQTEVRDHEPKLALDGGSDGLDFYRVIARDAKLHLKKDGLLMMEIGCDQAEEVADLLRAEAAYADIVVHKDLPGLDRVVACRLG